MGLQRQSNPEGAHSLHHGLYAMEMMNRWTGSTQYIVQSIIKSMHTIDWPVGIWWTSRSTFLVSFPKEEGKDKLPTINSFSWFPKMPLSFYYLLRAPSSPKTMKLAWFSSRNWSFTLFPGLCFCFCFCISFIRISEQMGHDSSSGNKRSRAEDEVYLDNFHSHKRYLSEVRILKTCFRNIKKTRASLRKHHQDSGISEIPLYQKKP